MSHLAPEIFGFALGLLLGSFLNVCISRVPAGASVVTPSSHCPQCGQTIRWFDNIPVLSWILLRGRCRTCGQSISWRYPGIELAFGVWCASAGGRLSALSLATRNDSSAFDFGAYWGDNLPQVMAFCVLGFLLLGLMVMDWQTHRLPDAFTLTGIAIGLFLVCIRTVFLQPGAHQIIFASKHLRLSSPGSFAARGNVFLTGTEALLYGRLLAVVGAGAILLLVRWGYRALRDREGLGLGDVKLLAMIAAFLGFWPAVLSLFLGVLLATGYAVTLLARRKADSLTRLPLGTFLAIGGLVTALFGDQILAWYLPFLTP